jgi:uncharacterized membrane protein YdbT with pleckstrin-like domain
MSRALWVGNPWVLPTVLSRSIAILAVAVLTLWLEFLFDFADFRAPIMPIVLWTVLALFAAWIVSTARPLLLRASNSYILREDGLEIRAGIVTSKSFIIAPSGFSDLEVVRSISARIVGSGDIVIHTQGDSDIRMEKVRSPLKVAAQIREVMGRPFARMGRSEPISEQAGYPARAFTK